MTAGPDLSDFVGRWRLSRQIADRAGGQCGRFEGTATFAETAEGLRYEEAGTLVLGAGSAVAATRSYLWRAGAGRIVVLHADGRPFHDFDPADPVATHDCAPDNYKVRYDFSAWPAWRAEWTVLGPRKDYTLTSLYARDA